jgi:hypothetical protein
VQRVAHEDTRHALFSANITQAPKIVAAVDARQFHALLEAASL